VGPVNPADVRDAIVARLDDIAGLRVTGYPPAQVVAPAGIVSYPEKIDFDLTYGRGMDRIPDWPVVLVVGKATERTAADRLYEYAAADGALSVKRALERGPGPAAWDDLQVTSCEFDVVEIAGVSYVAALFHLDIKGQGTL
jgi:hypothetical protein